MRESPGKPGLLFPADNAAAASGGCFRKLVGGKSLAMASEPARDADVIAARVAENDARFRQANENIRAAAERAGMERVPFVCECADLTCTKVVRISLDKYEEIRASGRRFLNAPGHLAADQGWSRPVEEGDGYQVVEKLGEAAAIAQNLDPRAEKAHG